MVEEVINIFKPLKKGFYVDGTLGGGGHSEALLRQCQSSNVKCQIIGIDVDKEAVEAAEKKLADFGKSIIYVNDNFVNIKQILSNLQIQEVNGILLDLGVSTHQLETPERGFSFNAPADIDMRLGQGSQNLTAKEILNNWQESDLRQIFEHYGESPFGSRIAREIVRIRAQKEIKKTDELVEIVKRATPPKWRYSREKHFATNIFRALRMTVNNELENLKAVIPDCVDVLAPGGRLIIITFHSLEDRIVKKAFQKLENPCECPPKAPVCMCGAKPSVKILTKKPILPLAIEINKNPKAKSAKLRAVEKL